MLRHLFVFALALVAFGQQGGGTEQKMKLFGKDHYFNVTGGVGEQYLNLFSGKNQVD